MNRIRFPALLLIAALCAALSPVWGQAPHSTQPEVATMHEEQTLTARQQAIVAVAAHAAAGDLPALKTALHQGLDAGLTVNDGKEVLVQLYAYAGFPRSLNALGVLMAVVEDRQQQGLRDDAGVTPRRPIPQGDALLAAGTANQTRLVGSPVQGALFEFAPAIDEYLKTHLFGDIFARDNLSWADREIATIAMLAAIDGAGPQLQAHIGMGMNTGLTPAQLHQLADVLAEHVNAGTAQRTRAALAQHTQR
ncbi:carboxymuconolactone decarboxylase [Alcanivorax sp. S71-1-4]|uniref:carboxymuconolactone decarboxylase family protein n=1 Tax=Alcanivorax sp. S71-1-4 TaxID=1177159 RepID=UPI001358E828|nr:carboxymuconolactone decarboxylase family protein [Alcanivorax sp. S71-1-4]KAF0810311.1 carboxymuconolactone decarboxylase [Alcanivorax sp. S71-1-4]